MPRNACSTSPAVTVAILGVVERKCRIELLQDLLLNWDQITPEKLCRALFKSDPEEVDPRFKEAFEWEREFISQLETRR